MDDNNQDIESPALEPPSSDAPTVLDASNRYLAPSREDSWRLKALDEELQTWATATLGGIDPAFSAKFGDDAEMLYRIDEAAQDIEYLAADLFNGHAEVFRAAHGSLDPVMVAAIRERVWSKIESTWKYHAYRPFVARNSMAPIPAPGFSRYRQIEARRINLLLQTIDERYRWWTDHLQIEDAGAGESESIQPAKKSTRRNDPPHLARVQGIKKYFEKDRDLYTRIGISSSEFYAWRNAKTGDDQWNKCGRQKRKRIENYIDGRMKQ